jgi:hypothetical protein
MALNTSEDEDVVFDAAGSGDTPSDVDGLVIEWSAGDRTARGIQATMNWSSEGSYTVILRVIDTDGAITELFMSVTVTNKAPEGTASVDRTEAGVGDIFNFAVLGLSDTPTDLEDLIITWSFGDGTLETGVTVPHKYEEAGDYIVTVTIRDDDNAQVETSLFITVTEDDGMSVGSMGLIAGVVVAVLVVVIIVILMYLRRESIPAEPEENGPNGPGTDTDDPGEEP